MSGGEIQENNKLGAEKEEQTVKEDEHQTETAGKTNSETRRGREDWEKKKITGKETTEDKYNNKELGNWESEKEMEYLRRGVRCDGFSVIKNKYKIKERKYDIIKII